MVKKSHVAILITTLTMQAQSMDEAEPITVKFDGFDTSNQFFEFKEARRCLKNECRIGKIYLKHNIPANSAVNLVIPARTKNGDQVVLDKAACAGWNNDNIKINLFLAKKRKCHQKCYDYVKIVGDKTDFFRGSTSLVNLDMRGVDAKPAGWIKCGKKQNPRRNKNLMTGMFDGCTGLKSIKWGHCNTRKVTRMDYMFRDCKNLERLNLNRLNTSKVGTMREMFANCYKLTTLDMNLCNVSKVQNMKGMFLNCKSLPNVNLTNYDMGEVQTIERMFEGCERIKSITFPDSDMKKLTTMQSMCENCDTLQTLDLSRVKIPASTKMTDFIEGCQELMEVSFHPCVPEEKIVNAIKNCSCAQLTDEEGLLLN